MSHRHETFFLPSSFFRRFHIQWHGSYIRVTHISHGASANQEGASHVAATNCGQLGRQALKEKVVKSVVILAIDVQERKAIVHTRACLLPFHHLSFFLMFVFLFFPGTS